MDSDETTFLFSRIKKCEILFYRYILILENKDFKYFISGKQGFQIFYFRKTRISNILFPENKDFKILFPENKDFKYFISEKQSVIKKKIS